jgi:hypothetical protein
VAVRSFTLRVLAAAERGTVEETLVADVFGVEGTVRSAKVGISVLR